MSDPTTVPVYVYDKNKIAAYFILERFVRNNASDDTDYATHMGKIDVLRVLTCQVAAVIDAAAVYCDDRTVANEHALIDAVKAVRSMGVQP